MKVAVGTHRLVNQSLIGPYRKPTATPSEIINRSEYEAMATLSMLLLDIGSVHWLNDDTATVEERKRKDHESERGERMCVVGMMNEDDGWFGEYSSSYCSLLAWLVWRLD